MSTRRLVVIGGVAAGMSAASRARRLDPDLEIIVLERGTNVSYGACGLPYFISGRIAHADDLIAHPASFFREKRNIDVRLEHEAIKIEPERSAVHALVKRSQPLAIQYDRLVLATGGAPHMSLPGSDRPNVFTLNDLDHAVHLRDFLDRQHPRKAVIIGSGYIGLEVADAFARRGIEVTIIERSGEVIDGLESEIADKLETTVASHGVKLHKGRAACTIAGPSNGPATHIEYGSGETTPCDLVLLATGLQPRTELATAAGIALGHTGAIAVDDRMQTNLPGIYAAGDCVETRHLVTGAPVYFPLGTTANKQGRVAGENAGGGHATFAGIVGTLVTKVFELEIGRTGLSLASARAAGLDADALTITGSSRVNYFDGKPLIVSLVWDRADGRLVGCQIAGEDAAAKRIDTAAVALHARMRLPDLLHLDLGYAPPFATVWEPLLIAAHEAHKKWKHNR
jgi:NADPH-dependent 2,4-dienoyl-CoA reductase/sulfur reductase-like enzyme